MKDSRTINCDDRRQKLDFISRVGALTGVWDFSWEPHKELRSLRANAYYHVAVVKSFYEYRRNQGESCTQDDCHELLKLLHNPGEFHDPVSGEVIRIGLTTRTDSPEFSAYVERCIAWLSEMGVFVPPPEMYGMQRRRSA
jgi:hypothetical protein